MSKLFLFGIGGTGSRVIKSLSFLLASGVRLQGCDELVPIIIDPHQDNEDLKRTTDILDLYEKIRGKLGDNNNSFFDAKISTLSSLRADNNLVGKNYTFDLKDEKGESLKGVRFKHFIDYDSLDSSNKALVNLLFAKEDLELQMDIGFVGNPHIGSIVLNQFKYSDEFQTFANNFDEGDRIFIISSIFGGTGASGFPTILKNIRTAKDNPLLSSTEFLENAPIGALSVMPYFNIEHSQESQIQKADWIQKTKSALSYYEKNVTGNNSVNVMYYLGDRLSKTYDNDPGQGGQKNDAHLIEFVGALSVIEYANMDLQYLQCLNGKAINPIAREYGIKEDVHEVTFNHIGNDTERLVGRNLMQFALMFKYLKNHFKQGKNQPYETANEPRLDSSFYQDIFYRDHIQNFLDYFNDWIKEMKSNKRSMNLVNLDNAFGETANGISAKKLGLFFKKQFGYDEFVTELNNQANNTNYSTKETKFLNLYFEATSKIISKNYDRFNS